MKNCEPLESGPEFTIETTPATVKHIYNNLISHLKNEEKCHIRSLFFFFKEKEKNACIQANLLLTRM